MTEPLARVDAICLAFPEVTQRPSHGAPTWFIRARSAFVTFWVDGHHDDDFPHLTLAGPPGAQEALIAADPQRYFRPPYVGHRGWVGVRMVGRIDWDLIARLCEDAYRVVAPATLVRHLDGAQECGSS